MLLIGAAFLWRFQYGAAVNYTPLRQQRRSEGAFTSSLQVAEHQPDRVLDPGHSIPNHATTKQVDGPPGTQISSIGVKHFERNDGPFAVSPSIYSACNDPGLKSVHFCDGLYRNLAQMEKEPRDSTWATTMEAELLAYVEHDFKEASVRNVECRMSWCAIEVQSTDRSFHSVFPYPTELSEKLTPQNWAVSTEKDSTGVNTEVIAVTYRRR
jgi:hypothetical protein